MQKRNHTRSSANSGARLLAAATIALLLCALGCATEVGRPSPLGGGSGPKVAAPPAAAGAPVSNGDPKPADPALADPKPVDTETGDAEAAPPRPPEVITTVEAGADAVVDASADNPPVVVGAGYPQGPYGAGTPDVGDVLEDIAVRGLANFEAAVSSELTVEPSSFRALRGAGKRYALLITAMGWCGSCKIAAAELGKDREADVRALTAAGGVIVHLLLEGASGAPTDDDLHNWARAAELDIAVFGPADERLLAVFPDREWLFLVELETMTVVFRQQVELYAKPTVTAVGLGKLQELLAK